jgi:hypothetical protein
LALALLLLVCLVLVARQQLLLTDQDSFGFEDVATDKYREVKDYFLSLGKRPRWEWIMP